eukprot:11196077-Lingulodinium_polyedra.AAC.1
MTCVQLRATQQFLCRPLTSLTCLRVRQASAQPLSVQAFADDLGIATAATVTSTVQRMPGVDMAEGRPDCTIGDQVGACSRRTADRA